MATTYRRRKQKAGSTAIPFMITILISLIVFGGVALYFYNKLTEKSSELPTMQSNTARISDADINSILYVLEPDDPDMQTAIMVMRFDPIRKQEFCLGIPLDLEVVHDGKVMSANSCLRNHGMESLKNAIAKTLDQPIDRYIQMNSDAFKTLVDLIGNVSFKSTIRDKGLQKTETAEALDTQQFETLLTSSKYSDEIERSTIIGQSVASLLNQCDGTRISANLDRYFSNVINLVTTDITAMDFSNHRHAISYVFQYASSPAKGISLICEQHDTLLKINADFVDQLKLTFNQKLVDTNSDKHNESSSEADTTSPVDAPLPVEAPHNDEE